MNRIKKFLPFISFSVLSLGAQGLVFIFNILVANKLSITDYGYYSLIFSFMNMLLLLSCQWHTSMVQYCGSAEYAEKGNLRETNQVRNSLFALCFLIVTIVCIIFKDRIENYVGGKYLGVILIIVFTKSIQELLSSYLIASGKRQSPAVNLFLIQIVSLFALIIIKVDITAVLLIQIFANVMIIQMIPNIKFSDYKPFLVQNATIKKCLRFALWQLMGSVAIYIISYGDNYIIKMFLSYDDIAVYNAAYKIFNAVFTASNTIATFYISPLADALIKKDSKSIKNIFWRERIIIFVLCTLLHLGLIIMAPQLFSILYQGKYDASVTIFRVLMVASIVRYWTVFEMVFFNSTGKIKVQQTLNVISAMLKVILSVVFIKMFGLIGVACSTLASTFIVGGASFMLSENKIIYLSREK